MKKWLWLSMGITLAASAYAGDVNAATSPIEFGNGAWVYDTTYAQDGTKQPPKAGLFVKALTDYNEGATSSEHKITQVFGYGGDIEVYCNDSAKDGTLVACLPNSFLLNYYPPGIFPDKYKEGVKQPNKKNTWAYWDGMGDSGYASTEQYKAVPGQTQHIIDLDGRVDNKSLGIEDYLDHMNDLNQADADHLADKVAKKICANDSVDGVQFDIEPFSFTGKGGTYQGAGQKYFYTEIAKDFAGYHGNSADPAGINPDASTDPYHCVDAAHPNGRSFSVFTFSTLGVSTPKERTEVVKVFNHHNNGYIVDSLYDLGGAPGGTFTSLEQFKKYIAVEIPAMEKLGVPYQFAIPAAASAHEYESVDGKEGIGAGNQVEYVKAALEAINPAQLKQTDPNFKGVDVWSWNQAMWWNGKHLLPASPETDTIQYMQSNL